nr:DUF2202 domain-containing protein [uncultured Desulfuromonas sp.]
MKSSSLIMSLLCVLLTASLCVAAGYRGGSGQQTPASNGSALAGTVDCLIDQLPLEELSEEEAAELLYMYEEEKVARDVYTALYATWGHWVFDHIATSEQRHMDAVAYLLERYELDFPLNADTVGMFDSDSMQDLYDSLVDRGSASLIDALHVGATIEDLDIYDLQEYLAQTDNEDIMTVYQNLLRGSRNHLRSFVYQLSLNDVEYAAQYLTQEEVDAIVNSEREAGRANANGGSMDSTDRAGQNQNLQDCPYADDTTDA